MTKLALAALAFATLATGCINMSTRRPSGGSQIQKTAPSETADPIRDSASGTHDALGER